jgi:flagellar biosynthetic protein FlhB
MASDDIERTEAPTPRRRQEARERGQVARSPELNSALILLGAFGALALGGPTMGGVLLGTVRDGLDLGGRADLHVDAVRGLFVGAASAVLRGILPVALTGAAMGLLANLLQVGFLVTPESIQLNWARVNPAQGLKNLLSVRGLAELVKAILKISILGAVVYWTIRPEWDRFADLAQMGLTQLLQWELALGLRLGLRVAGVYCLVGLADYGYQRWQHERSLRMSRGEIQEESHQQEGNPQVRARVRSLQRERSVRRMMQEVPKASVVVVNPTHIAVALRYDHRSMRAPRVVAKGKRLMAERILAAARAAGVPVVQDIPLARALEKSVNVGGEIPAALYRAVAKILAYVYAQGPRRAAV